MRYHTNFIGSLFGLFGGRKIIAIPDVDDLVGMPELRIRILKTINDNTMDNYILKNHPEMKDEIANKRIAIEKLINYQTRLLEVNGYYGEVDFYEMRQIEEEMHSDWWIKQLKKGRA